MNCHFAPVVGCIFCFALVGCRGESVESETDSLIESFQDESEDGMVAARAMYRLVEIGQPAVPKLIAALETGDVRVKLMALNTLGLIGPEASAALPAVRKAIEDSDKDVQNRARDALAKIDPNSA